MIYCLLYGQQFFSIFSVIPFTSSSLIPLPSETSFISQMSEHLLSSNIKAGYDSLGLEVLSDTF